MVAGFTGLLLRETENEEMFEKVSNIENVVPAQRRSRAASTTAVASEMHALGQPKGEGGEKEVKREMYAHE